MTTTTSYGSWYNHAGGTGLTIEDYVATFVAGAESEWLIRIERDGSFDAMVEDYRNAINAALPAGVLLGGNDFYGPYYDDDKSFEGYPVNGGGRLDISEIIDGVDLGKVVEKNDPDNA